MAVWQLFKCFLSLIQTEFTYGTAHAAPASQENPAHLLYPRPVLTWILTTCTSKSCCFPLGRQVVGPHPKRSEESMYRAPRSWVLGGGRCVRMPVTSAVAYPADWSSSKCSGKVGTDGDKKEGGEKWGKKVMWKYHIFSTVGSCAQITSFLPSPHRRRKQGGCGILSLHCWHMALLFPFLPHTSKLTPRMCWGTQLDGA